ncbi:MAG: YHS domain-containing protein, partial [Alphaproteobacteria bacterium]
MDQKSSSPKSRSGAGPADAITRDPVCAMEVATDAGKPTHQHQGHVYHFCCTGCRDKFAADPNAYIKAKDPVCAMTVDRATARHVSKHTGERFYFCSSHCQEKFDAEPETYLAGRPTPEKMP